MADQVHLLVGGDPQGGSQRRVKRLKGHSAQALRGEVPVLKRRLAWLWAISSFGATLGGVTRQARTRSGDNQPRQKHGDAALRKPVK